MLLRRLKSNNGINLFFFPVAVLAFWAKSLLHPFVYDYSFYENKNILFTPIVKLVGDNPLAHVILSVVLVLILTFFMQLINDRYSFIRIRSKLPSVLFAIILGGFVGMHTLHPIYFGAIFVLFAIYRLFNMFEKTKAYSAIFDVGFILGVSSLFCLNLVILFPAFLISVAILSRETKFRELLILLLGFLLPFAFALSYAFLTNNFQETLNIFAQSITVPVNHFKTNYALQGYLAVLVLYTLLASMDILKQYDKKKISSRKYFSAFFWIFVFSLIGFTLVPATSQEMLVITAIPVTFLISNFFIFMKKRFWGELLFALLLLIVVFMQFAEQIFNG
jgi:hypothetical protein